MRSYLLDPSHDYITDLPSRTGPRRDVRSWAVGPAPFLAPGSGTHCSRFPICAGSRRRLRSLKPPQGWRAGWVSGQYCDGARVRLLVYWLWDEESFQGRIGVRQTGSSLVMQGRLNREGRRTHLEESPNGCLRQPSPHLARTGQQFAGGDDGSGSDLRRH